MAIFESVDGTRLAYHRLGSGDPLICLPGGPMRASAYLGDLGGLSAHRTLIRLDLRGTGESAVPADPSSYRVDRQVADVEALRVHLGLEQLDLLGHSAGAALAFGYAAAHPDRINRLLLLTPSPRSVGVQVTPADQVEMAESRTDQSWFPEAMAALRRIVSGEGTADDRPLIEPFSYGRWDEAAQAHAAEAPRQRNSDAAAVYYSGGALDPVATRAGLSGLSAPVLLMAGEYDVYLPPTRAVEYANLFRQAELVVLPGGGHYPWLDDAAGLGSTVTTFLR